MAHGPGLETCEDCSGGAVCEVGRYAHVARGDGNIAAARAATVSDGFANVAIATAAAVSGGAGRR